MRFGHRVKDTVWREGEEEVRASECVDDAAAIIVARMTSRES